MSRGEPISILKDLRGILKVKVVKKRVNNDLQINMANDNMSASSCPFANLNNLSEPRLNCSFSNYEKILKCNT